MQPETSIYGEGEGTGMKPVIIINGEGSGTGMQPTLVCHQNKCAVVQTDNQ